MIYRETGQFKTNYSDDQALFPIAQDRYVILAVLFITFVLVPFIINEYWLNAILLPFLIYTLAALGLNILTGYCGQLSLGTGAFMAVGAFSIYKLMVAVPELGFIPLVIISGLITAAVGTLFGLPSLRIKGFYLAVATLAAQFFLIWLFNKVGWFFNYNATGMITSPPMTLFGVTITGPRGDPVAKYLLVAAFVAVFALFCRRVNRCTPANCQTIRFRGFFLLYRYGRCPVFCGMAWIRGANRSFRYQSVVSGIVYDYNRWARVGARFVSGCGFFGNDADIAKKYTG